MSIDFEEITELIFAQKRKIKENNKEVDFHFYPVNKAFANKKITHIPAEFTNEFKAEF